MKIPKARHLPSGSWCCRVMVDGKSTTITKPTKKEAEQAAAAIKSGAKAENKKSCTTVSMAIDNYIDMRDNVLSPSTIRGYRCYQSERFKSVMNRRISEITDTQWQRVINAEAEIVSAKTLKNAWGFLASVIREETGRTVNVRLPQVIQNDLPFLTAEQIPVFIEAAKGDSCEIAVLLGLSGLRRSEILAIRWQDIDTEKNCIHVNGAAVYNEDGNVVYKQETKNQTSRRIVPFLIPSLKEAVLKADKSDDHVVKCAPNTISKAALRICKKAGLPEIRAHGLRRSFASLCYHLKVPEAIVMKAGGWSDIYTMRKIYTKISEKDIQSQGEAIQSFFSNL